MSQKRASNNPVDEPGSKRAKGNPGSPKDDKSHEKGSGKEIIKLGGPRPPPVAKRPKEWPHHDPAITDYSKVPSGWSSDEPDLWDTDIDGNIARCHVRLQENIMPMIFQARLHHYVALQTERDKLLASAPGKPWPVILRLKSLKSIRETLIASKDHYEQLPNVNAIIEAYERGELTWQEGLVTYWKKGVQLCAPKKFEIKDFLKVNEFYKGEKGFWVEGIQGVSPVNLKLLSFLEPCEPILKPHEVTIHVRIPGAPYSTNYLFMEDTGASSMCLYQADIDELHWTSPGWRAPGLGFYTALTANGPRVDPAVLLEAAVISSDGRVLINWTPTTVLVFPGYCPPGDPHGRLSGRWFRQMIATVQIPDNSGRLFLGTEREDLDEVPGFDQRAARPPLITPHPPWQPPPAPPLPPPLSWEPNWAMFPQAYSGMPSSPGPGTGAPAPPYTGPPTTGPHLTGPGGPLIVSGNKIPGGTAPQGTANVLAHTGPSRGSTRQRLRNILRRPFSNPRRRAGRYTARGDGLSGDGGNWGGGN